MRAAIVPHHVGDNPARCFEQTERLVLALIRGGYRHKMPLKRSLDAGEFALEKLPEAGGWRITVEPFCGGPLPFPLDTASAEAPKAA